MATTQKPLTHEEFESRYAGSKPYVEYWYGTPVRKSMPTLLHSFLQRVIIEFLIRFGYKAGPEVEIRVDPDWNPVADVFATTAPQIELPYPTKAVEVVVEILSPDDRMSRVHEKCRGYERIGTQAIFVLDPAHRGGWFWKNGRLESVEKMSLPNGQAIVLSDVWTALDAALGLPSPVE